MPKRVLQVRLQQNDYDALVARAREANISVSQLARKLIVGVTPAPRVDNQSTGNVGSWRPVTVKVGHVDYTWLAEMAQAQQSSISYVVRSCIRERRVGVSEGARGYRDGRVGGTEDRGDRTTFVDMEGYEDPLNDSQKGGFIGWDD